MPLFSIHSASPPALLHKVLAHPLPLAVGCPLASLGAIPLSFALRERLSCDSRVVDTHWEMHSLHLQTYVALLAPTGAEASVVAPSRSH